MLPALIVLDALMMRAAEVKDMAQLARDAHGDNA